MASQSFGERQAKILARPYFNSLLSTASTRPQLLDGSFLVFLKHQEVVIRKELKILHEVEAGLFCFTDGL